MIALDNPPPPPRDVGKEILIAVAVAGLSAVFTGLVTWGIDELRAKFGSSEAEKCPKCRDSEDKHA